MHFLQDKHQGIKTVLIGLYKALLRRGTEHEFVFLFNREDEISEAWSRHGEIALIGEMSRNARLAYGMARAIRRAGGVDVSHFNAVVPFGVPGRVLLTVHDILFMTYPEYFSRGYRIKQRLAANWSLRRADLVGVVSEYSLKVLRRDFPRQASAFRLMANGIDYEAFAATDRESAAARVFDRLGLREYMLTVSRIDPRKNHINMLLAYERLATQFGAENLPPFVIVGDIDNNYVEGRALIKRLSKKLLIYWLRDVDDTLLRDLYSGALFTVMASHAEGFGLPIAESMASGTPVVAGDNTAMPEVAGDCALLVDSQSVDSIMQAYKELICEPCLRQRLSVCGHERARILDWSLGAERYINLLNKLDSR